MPKRSRPVMSSIFHASSVFGTLLAAAVGYFILADKPWGENTWKLGFLIGVLPALLTLWIRWKLHEPERWQKAKEAEAEDESQATGRLSELFTPENARGTLLGVALATIGLVTFWGCHIYGKNALMRAAETEALTIENLQLPRRQCRKMKMQSRPEKIIGNNSGKVRWINMNHPSKKLI